MPFPPDKGDRIRAYQLLRYLAPKAAVHLACLADEPVQPDWLDELRPLCERVTVVQQKFSRWFRALGSLMRGRTVTEGAFNSPQLLAAIRQWAGQTRFDCCLASASSVAPYLQVPELAGVPALVDLVDVDSQKWLDYSANSRGWRKWLYGLEGRRLRRAETNLQSWAHAVTLVSDAEADLYRQFCPTGEVHVVTNGVDLDYFAPQFAPRGADCVFLGALDYKPNVDGLIWFCNEVWPSVIRHRPDSTLELVGRRPVPAVKQLANITGVRLIGQVDDVRPYLAKAAITVAPLLIARGVQNKILEAMAMAKPTIVSVTCLKGLEATPDRDLLVADTPEQWTQSILRLLADADLREKMGAAAREFVVKHHRWERCLALMDTLLKLEPQFANN
jgi:sugar transferase (PEP-CTERM/EpsH1 system associated)